MPHYISGDVFHWARESTLLVFNLTSPLVSTNACSLCVLVSSHLCILSLYLQLSEYKSGLGLSRAQFNPLFSFLSSPLLRVPLATRADRVHDRGNHANEVSQPPEARYIPSSSVTVEPEQLKFGIQELSPPPRGPGHIRISYP